LGISVLEKGWGARYSRGTFKFYLLIKNNGEIYAMKTKILGILLIVMFLIVTTVLTMVSSTDKNDGNQVSDEVYVDDNRRCSSNIRSATRFPVKDNLLAPLDPNYTSPKSTTQDTPDYFNWKDYEGHDWTTPIKDQLQDVCGSCWAFGALGGLESTIKIWENNPDLDIVLSEQYLLSCSSGSCDGWYLSSTLSWIKRNGMITEECLPYQADDTIPCESKCPDWREYLIGIKNYKKIARGNITAIQEDLIEYGPLPATMEVYEDFYPNYTGGVYKYTNGGYVFGHVVTIVGYDNTWGGEDEGYWICKNSWGTEWGEDGWFKIAYGECKIENYVYYLEGPNYSPLKPEKPNGASSGKPGIEYTYSTSCIDPDGNRLYYWFDWGDGNNSDWIGPYESGETIIANYTWESEGTYHVKVKTIEVLSTDIDRGIESEWSDPLPISMPKNKPYINTPFLQFLENHPRMFPLLRHMLEL
jgi:C1A family cysteine protease